MYIFIMHFIFLRNRIEFLFLCSLSTNWSFTAPALYVLYRKFFSFWDCEVILWVILKCHGFFVLFAFDFMYNILFTNMYFSAMLEVGHLLYIFPDVYLPICPPKVVFKKPWISSIMKLMFIHCFHIDLDVSLNVIFPSIE